LAALWAGGARQAAGPAGAIGTESEDGWAEGGRLRRGAGRLDADDADSPGEGAEDFYPPEFGRIQRPCAPNAPGAQRRKSSNIRRLWQNGRRPKGT